MVPSTDLNDERYRRIIEMAHEGICTVDTAGIITYANARLAEMLDFRGANLVGRPLFEFMAPEAAFEARTRFARQQRGISEVNEVLFQRADGKRVWARASASSMFDARGTFTGAIYVLGDVTEWHTTQHRLVESERLFRALTEQSSELVSIVDADGIILYANATHSRLLGFEPEEMLGRSIFDFIHPDDLPAIAGKIKAIGRDEGRTFAAEYRAIHKDGTLHFLRGVAQNLLEDPAVGGIVINAHDITDGRLAESALREAHQAMATLVDASPLAIVTVDLDGVIQSWNPAAERIFGWTAAEVVGLPNPIVPPDQRAFYEENLRTRLRSDAAGVMKWELQRLRKDGTLVDIAMSTAQMRHADGTIVGVVALISDITESLQLEAQLRQAQKMEAVGRLAGGIAHDFNNVLTVITSYAMMLMSGLAEDAPALTDLREITAAVDRASTLTRQMLAFSRQQVLQPRVIALTDIIEDIETMLRRLIGEDIEMTIAGTDEPTHVLADPGQIEQVAMNLVVNARDAMPSGGHLVISVRRAALTMIDVERFPYVKPGEYVLMTVRDTGCGMDQDTQLRIFEPFFTTKGVGKGTGLGLSTVYGIVKQSDGYIWVDSAPDSGTTFSIYLPSVPPAVQEAEPSAIIPAVTEQHAATVMLAEDDPALRSVILRVLGNQGYTVLSATDGEDALTEDDRYGDTIHMLITDVVMPRMGGPELARRLTQKHGDLRVLFVTGYSQEAMASQGGLLPGAQLLKKPFTPEELALAASDLLGTHPAMG